ncbi:probable phosphoinositide 3-kinase regulatory subunit 4 [Coccomyxa sp. Obi]|nr:probable phosphoinositide 3-kinase regulatory subunit 4 [Coccomyxa sp. Obi]
MGNQLSQPQKLQPEHLAEVPKVVLKENLGGGRFLKTLLCLHDDGGLVVVKVYYKRDDVPDLRVYEARLLEIRERLSGPACVHVLPFQAFLESDRAAYLIRPYIFADLYHRLSTRPFLSSIEKRWIAFQLLHALAQVHERGVCHGDIKCENALVTSWNWVYLADFASYKPTYLPVDNPADFSFYFDTGGRRRCYIAPERFYESGTSDPGQLAMQRLLPEMDVFSMGCVIAELFMEGKALFDLSKLLSYRRGEYDPSSNVSQVEAPIRKLILHMIQLEPGKRLSPAAYLEQWGPRLFPPYFEAVLHPFFTALLPMDADERVAAMLSSFPQFALFMQPPHGRTSPRRPETAASPGAAEGHMSQSSKDASEGPGSLDRSVVDPGGIAGGLGTQLSSVAGPAMQVDLLANVGALLADTQSLLTRLQDGDAADADDGDFFAADPSTSPGRQASPSPDSAPSSAQPAQPADEVATDEVYEFQFREEEDGPFCERLLGRAGSRSWGGHAAARKEDVLLPSEGGWLWTSNWQVENQVGSSSDSEGWQYREPSSSGAAEARPANPLGEQGWSAHSGPNCTWRRRRWVRHRRRRLHALDGSTLAAGYQGTESASDGMVLITVLLCTLVRGAKLQEAKTRAVALLSRAAAMCDDDTRLQRVVPYLLSMMLKGEAPASVQCAALRSLSHVLSTIDTVPNSDAKIFNEYILPALSLIPAEAEESVRVEYAGILAQLAATARRFLMRLQMPVTPTQQQAGGAAVVRYEEQMGALRSAFTGVFQDLVVSPRSTPFSRRAILPHLPHLASVLGRKLSNDFLLPTMITFLNDRDWQTRAAFFRDVSCIASQAGFSGMEAFLLPCALADESEAVIAEAIGFLTRVVEGRHMRKRSLLAATARVVAKLQHSSSTAVRAAASDFIAAAARSLSPAETYALLTPLVMPAMASEPVLMTEPRSVSACLRHVSNGLHEGPTRGTPRYGGRPPLSSRPSSSSTGRTGTLLQQLPSAPLYTVTIDPKFLRPGASRLTAALEGLNASGQDGHIIARAESGPSARRATQLDNAPPPQHAADVARLVAHAKRLNKPIAEMASVSGRLAAGVRSIHLSSESPLSFQPGGASRGISDAIDAAIHTDLPAHPYAANLASSTPWQPRGVLVAHLAEHKRAVNRIAVAPNGAFFVTASNDETCKIWDSRRLEKDISFRSKLTYAATGMSIMWEGVQKVVPDVQGGKVLAVAACEESQSVASASSNGSVHVWRVEYTSRSGGAPDRYTGIIGMLC